MRHLPGSSVTSRRGCGGVPHPAGAWATSPATQAALTSTAPSAKEADHEPSESKASPCVSPAGVPGCFAFWFAFLLGLGAPA